ncbi:MULTISPECIES: MFS transporter [Aneurinibacillus]|uniref:Predicted arabinose efflux permease, MFS family n=1 Tax=Aneurinibacillus thermoaerophilus TaxID=143495 RepID=A0A1G8BZP9_ANETH|nr:MULTISPECIES: MFS transporter [Aneurinibacillus]AMA71961.1 MFS transporter [Aneurinibacillus sp. XH2]MED0675089.1 MFS transporter [Aneurinibacillus thermoaerophilus]MED0679237.1 MFS transporter [Aneurinibacillus thermoaerophilus]MED0737123.1 MFS transporter [Aneurinibacillus thermoaerophilus]MED0757169.1 MFS transporter [Aneurinibacillus thermoaerophilus]
MKAPSRTDVSPALWTRDFILTTVSNLFLFTSFQMLIPTLPVYVEQSGGNEFSIGLVIGIFTVFALLARPFAGKALDTLGRRKVMAIGLLIFILSVAGYYWTTTVFLILSLRVIHGIGWGIATTSFGTVVSDIIPAQRRGEGMGYYGLSSTLAMALAPLFGIWLVEKTGFGMLFFVSTLLAVISFLLSQIIRYPDVSVFVPSPEPKHRNRLDEWLEVKALFPSFLAIMLGLTYGGIVTFITLFGKEAGITNVGWFFLTHALMVMIVRPVAGKLFDRRGHVWILLPGAFFTAVGLLFLSYSNNLLSLILASVFYGIGFGAIQPTLQAWTINRVAPNRRGAANGTFFSGFDLGIGAGAMLLGTIATATSYAVMYRISIVFMGLYLITYSLYLAKSAKKSA